MPAIELTAERSQLPTDAFRLSTAQARLSALVIAAIVDFVAVRVIDLCACAFFI